MYKLLIVDDEPLVRVGVQSMLDWTSLEIEVTGTARNGSHAEELMRLNMPDIVIADIKMPIKNGLQLAQDSYNENGRIPVFIILTSFEEFEYARQALQAQAVDYLIKMELDAEKLENAVKKAIVIIDQHRANQPGIQQSERGSIQTLREKFFIRLLNDLFDNDAIYDAQMRDLNIDIQCGSFVVANCTIILPKQDTQEPGHIISLYNNAMRLVRETLTRYTKCFVVPLDMAYFTVIFCLDSQMSAEQTAIQQVLYQTVTALQDYLSIQMFSAVGQRVDSLRQISISYRQAQRDIHGITADDPVVFYKENANDTVAYITQVQEIRHGIRKAFEELDTQSLNESLGNIAATFERHPDEFLQAMDTACNILYMAISLLPQGEALLEGIFSNTPEGYRVLYQMRDTASIAAWIRQFRDGCLEQLQSHKQSYNEHVVESVKAYIRENLGKHLSLQTVAAVFNFNPNYLSHLFSKYAGLGFVEYITGARIAAAKELLAQDKLRIYEIAELLGFEDSFYFSKVFKKAEGLSPSEYIHKNR